MADSVINCDDWQVEQIPDDDILYLRILAEHYHEEGEVFDSIVFSNREGPPGVFGMSTDWGKYGSPRSTQAAGRRKPQEQNYHVVSISVRAVRNIPGPQTVIHDPVCKKEGMPDNRAHTNVLGPKSRKELGDQYKSNLAKLAFIKAIVKWEIKL